MNYKISMDSIITIPGYMAWRMYGDFGILIKIAKGQHPCHVLFELNDIACWIWDIIAKTGSLRFSELLNRVNSEFSLKRQGAINDIESFLRDAVSKGILRVSGTQNFHLERKSLHAGSEKNLWSNKIWERYFNNSIDKCIPITATIDLTNRCNQRCVHCYNKNHSFEKVSLSDFYSVLDQLQELGTLKILFTGGEPLLRKDFFKIAQHARKKGFAIMIFTNATLIDEKMAKDIAYLQPLSVETTIFSPSADVHDRITKLKGSLNKTLNGVKLLKENNVPVMFKTSIIKNNISSYRDVEHFALHKLGVGFRGSSYLLTPRHDLSMNPLRYMADAAEIVKHIEYNNNTKTSKKRPVFKKYICGCGRTTLYINAEGNLSACIEADSKGWNIKTNRIKKYWHSGRDLQEIRGLSTNDLKDCITCDAKSKCIYRCVALSKRMFGSYAKMFDRYCDISRGLMYSRL